MNVCLSKKSKVNRHLFVVGIFLAIFFYLPLTPSSIQHPASTIHSYLPNFFSEALDFSDLDVRDAANRPVRTADARANLQQLFAFSVVRLLVDDALPLITSVRRILEKLLAPLSEGFSRAKKWLMGKVFWAIAFAVKKFSDLFDLSPLWSPVLLGDPNLRGEGRLFNSQSTIRNSQLNLPLRC